MIDYLSHERFRYKLCQELRMEKIARCIYFISLITGWFCVRYDAKKKRVRYWKLIYVIGRVEFYFIAILGGFRIQYDKDFIKALGFDAIMILMAMIEFCISFYTVIKFNSHLKRVRFEIIDFINRSIKFYGILKDWLDFVIDKRLIRIMILKIVLIDLVAISIKVAYEDYKNEPLSTKKIFSIILSILFSNFLNFNNLHLIIMRSLLNCLNQRMRKILKTNLVGKR